MRAWAVEGTGGHDAGLARHLAVSRSWCSSWTVPNGPSGDGAKSDPLDAERAAREALARAKLGTPRFGGDRQGLAVLLSVRGSAVDAAGDAQRQLFSYVVAAPEHDRDRLREREAARDGQDRGPGCGSTQAGTLTRHHRVPCCAPGETDPGADRGGWRA